jgi:hypothetical protein
MSRPYEFVPDNFYGLEFPARMSDGRQFTDYHSSCLVNSKPIMTSSLEFREYLQKNGTELMDNYDTAIFDLNGCNTCSSYNIVPPYMFVKCDKTQCTRMPANIQNGIGIQNIR